MGDPIEGNPLGYLGYLIRRCAPAKSYAILSSGSRSYARGYAPVGPGATEPGRRDFKSLGLFLHPLYESAYPYIRVSRCMLHRTGAERRNRLPPGPIGLGTGGRTPPLLYTYNTSLFLHPPTNTVKIKEGGHSMQYYTYYPLPKGYPNSYLNNHS
jgi:hypothetical protein